MMMPLLLIALSLWVINLCLALSLPNEPSAIALHLPQLYLQQCICGIQAASADPASLGKPGAMQGCWQSWHGQDP